MPAICLVLKNLSYGKGVLSENDFVHIASEIEPCADVPDKKVARVFPLPAM